MASRAFILFLICILFPCVDGKEYNSYKGLVMTGYQGWFNTPGDGAERNWHHYSGKDGFRPGSCSIDFWPDTKEYKKLYPTPFSYKNGKIAKTFSSYDAETTELHFKWMRQYGIDGAFMQRFIGEISNKSGKKHFDTVFHNAVNAASLHNRAIAIMYDLSGMPQNGVSILLNDAKELKEKYQLDTRKKSPTYLYHQGKPLITVWGVGFNDKRSYGLPEAEQIITGLHQLGFSVMLGVPAYWRTLDRDTTSDPKLLELIKTCEVILPWAVGRYNNDSYPHYLKTLKEDLLWCNQAGIDYAPLCFPGFSWKNMKGANSAYISREKGAFFKAQLSGAINAGAQMLYLAMFDEVDEGTAIFKCLNKKSLPLNKDIPFEGIDDDLPTDHYLRLAGEARKKLLSSIKAKQSIKALPKQADSIK